MINWINLKSAMLKLFPHSFTRVDTDIFFYRISELANFSVIYNGFRLDQIE